MKKFLIFFLLIANFSYAEDKIVYLDMNILLKESNVGKFVNTELKKISNRNIDELTKIETSIKDEDQKLIKQKNILKEEEYKIKADQLILKFKEFQNLTKKKNMELNNLKTDAGNKILKSIKEILSEYSKKNAISIIINKNNIIIGKVNLDITSDILDLLNKKISKIEFN